MELKTNKHKKKHLKFDEKAIRELLTQESKFISQLWENSRPRIDKHDDVSDFLTSGRRGHAHEEEEDDENEIPVPTNRGTSRAKSLEELNERLQKLKGKRLDYKGKVHKKGLKNKITKKKKKDNHKFKKTLIKAKLNKKLKPGPSKEPKPQKPISEKQESQKPKSERQESQKPKSEKQEPIKPIYNSEGLIMFNKLDVPESGVKSKVLKKKKSNNVLLKKLEEETSKLKKIEEKNPEKALEIKEKKAWRNILARAEGQKVKDNPELLKKSLKRLKSKKNSSKKKWNERVEEVKRRQDERQKKRKENIQARNKERKQKKIKKFIKKGRLIPGIHKLK